MNLHENIHRIQSMMGIITEDRKEMVVKNMIDNIGLGDTVKMVGNYDEVATYLTDKDKVKYIKNRVLEIADEVGSNGVVLSSPQGNPLRIKDEDGIKHQIEFLGQSRARVEVYEKGTFHNGYVISYEDLQPQEIDKIIKRLIEM